jgi:hypothetical protein
VSVLASCESPEQVELARARGYATSMVVAEFADRKLHEICRTAPVSPPLAANIGSPLTAGVTGQRPERGASVTSAAAILPCPAQTTEKVTCSSCRLCMSDGRLRDAGYSIGFHVHGTAVTVKKAIRSLATPGDDERRLTSRDHALAFQAEHGRLPRQTELRQLAGITRGSAREMLARLRDEQRTAA